MNRGYYPINLHIKNMLFFSHPDFTVGFGITPNQPNDYHVFITSMPVIRVADYTAGRELHPAPKNFLILFSIYIYILQPIIENVNCIY